jgi:endonuclease/exonuclease/phosphatase family metal-dependent hydrolase
MQIPEGERQGRRRPTRTGAATRRHSIDAGFAGSQRVSAVSSGPGYTWTVDDPAGRAEIDHIIRQPGHRRRLDYVFVGSWHAHPDAHCHIEHAAVAFEGPVDETWVSDHYGVVVDMDIGPNS